MQMNISNKNMKEMSKIMKRNKYYKAANEELNTESRSKIETI